MDAKNQLKMTAAILFVTATKSTNAECEDVLSLFGCDLKTVVRRMNIIEDAAVNKTLDEMNKIQLEEN